MKFQPQRQLLVDLCQQLSHQGYFAGTGGNIMLRLDAAHVAVTPSATSYATMSAEDICVLSLRNLKQTEGAKVPSVESSLHAHVMRLRPDAGCTIHTHQPTASACALLGDAPTVPPHLQDSLGAHIAVVGYAPSGTGLLAAKLKWAVRDDVNTYLMRNHGVVCCGKDSSTAMAAIENLEALAKNHLRALIQRRRDDEKNMPAALAHLLTEICDDLAR
ncbi:class II aldolase/adducin family protein [Rhodoferax saidenbachensis]|uniref:Aldolase n=1 Tax=Rhodoferax saidenbachensis TaxID=1484693 RepID=A0A1P8KB21_9BURK|nr:class II aldolase/adducin family protein [Rhodoferax saidenbachensis]APW43175.1 aldolase [Rhodoferax saidenbachensis]